MDLRSLAIFMLDLNGKIIFSNPPAAELLDYAPALTSADGIWLGPLPPEGGVMDFDPGDTGESFRLSRTRLTNGRPEIGYTGVLLARPGQPPERRRERLMEAWRFTPAELRLAEAMLDGMAPCTAAESLGVTIHTVRTYLKRLYHKLGVHSQATMVCALAKSIE